MTTQSPPHQTCPLLGLPIGPLLGLWQLLHVLQKLHPGLQGSSQRRRVHEPLSLDAQVASLQSSNNPIKTCNTQSYNHLTCTEPMLFHHPKPIFCTGISRPKCHAVIHASRLLATSSPFASSAPSCRPSFLLLSWAPRSGETPEEGRKSSSCFCQYGWGSRSVCRCKNCALPNIYHKNYSFFSRWSDGQLLVASGDVQLC